MVSKFFSNLKFKIKNSSNGITIVEIAVVIFIVVLFSTIIIADFPKMQRQFALSRVTYKLAQDLRKTEDLGLSGLQIKDNYGNSIKAQGYGIYIDLNNPEEYIIYADRAPVGSNPDYKYDVGNQQCSDNTDPTDCIIETIDLMKENPNLKIKKIVDTSGTDIGGTNVSINFRPPNPIINISNLNSGKDSVGIVLGLNNDDSSRTVWVNTSGLINVE